MDLSDGDYPPVVRLLLLRGPGRGQRDLPWDAVQTVDWELRRILVHDLGAARAAPPEALTRAVLLKRDVMDALLLDVAARQTMRANDLWLSEMDGCLRLQGADVSPWAVLRRIGRGLFGRGADRRLLDWRDMEFLRGDPRAATRGRDYHRRVASLQPAEIARLLDQLPYLHAAELLMLIPDEVATDTLEAMSPERQIQVFEELDHERAIRLLNLMAPDLAADLLGRLTPEQAASDLAALPAARRAPVIDLLRYPEDTVGGMMTNDLARLPIRLTVGEARRALRDQLSRPDFVYYVYVVDQSDQDRLLGVVTLRELLLADESTPLRDVMRRATVTLDPLQPAAGAARQVAEQHLAALPVVTRDGRLVGAVTADAALIQLAPPDMKAEAPRLFS